MVIAIDGPAGAGKSTVARALAEQLGGTYLDSGAMYRCVALLAARAGLDPDDRSAIEALAERARIEFRDHIVSLDGEDVTTEIRTAEVSALASRVSIHPGVRAAMVDRQRELVAEGVWAAEGRDIGTVVCPEAPLKVFLTAKPDERARRRADETGERHSDVLASIADRDRRDSEREHGALQPAADSVEVDTTGLTVDEVVERIAVLARERGLT
jgi:cytidylate kinase